MPFNFGKPSAYKNINSSQMLALTINENMITSTYYKIGNTLGAKIKEFSAKSACTTS